MRRFYLLALLVLLVACSKGGEATPTPTPQALLDRAAAAWNQTQSFSFALVLAGRSFQVDEGGLLTFNQAAGQVVAPDRVRASATIQTMLGNAEIGYIAIGDQQWITNPLSGAWETAPPEYAGQVSALFNRERGIGVLLSKIQGIERLPDETVSDAATIHLRGTLAGSDLALLVADLPPQVQVDLWMGQQDDRLRRIVLTEPGGESPTTWTFDFSAFDAPVTIEPPP